MEALTPGFQEPSLRDFIGEDLSALEDCGDSRRTNDWPLSFLEPR